ncbi:MAG: hypothetical protein KC766_34505, partial [Myxococcales bacterium]|nr:hypothetical protein [Myxococcales bacterium]
MSREAKDPRVDCWSGPWSRPPAGLGAKLCGLLVALSALGGCAHEGEPARVPSSAYQGPWSPQSYYYLP